MVFQYVVDTVYYYVYGEEEVIIGDNIIKNENKSDTNKDDIELEILDDNKKSLRKKLNHFKKWFENYKTADIPDEVIISLMKKIDNSNIDISSLTYNKTKMLLVDLNRSDYIKYAQFITNKIKGFNELNMKQEHYDTLEKMVSEIQFIYIINKYSDDDNYHIPHMYMVHKCLELKGYDSYLYYFPYTKLSNKLKDYDVIWAKICKSLEWDFIKSC
jgi:hypothetical protein